MSLVHTGGQFPFLRKQCFRLIAFEFGPNFCAKMPAPSMSINELISLPDLVSRTTTMPVLVDLPGCLLRHAIVNNTHKTHTATLFAISPRAIQGFLNLKSGFDSRQTAIPRCPPKSVKPSPRGT